MNRFFSNVSQVFGSRDISQHPELYKKQNRTLDYTLTMYSSLGLNGNPRSINSIDWKAL